MNDQTVALFGWVATDPVLVRDRAGTTTTFRVGGTSRHYDARKRRWTDDPTQWFDITCRNELAQGVHASINKGEPINVTGRLRESVPVFAIEATVIGHDLTRGTSTFRRDLGTNP